MEHRRTCDIGETDECSLCKRVNDLLRIHAEKCPLNGCSVPRCQEFKQAFRIGNDKKRPRDEPITKSMSPVAIKKNDPLPVDAAKNCVVTKILEEGEIDETSSKVTRL